MTESNQLALRDRSDMLAPSTDSWVAVVRDVSTLASQICDTDFVPTELRWKEGELVVEDGVELRDLGPAAARVTAVILHGRELGLPPMTSLALTHVIEGRPSVAAEAMRAMVLQAGHEIVFVETTTARCIMKGRRRQRGAMGLGTTAGEWTEVTWTMADAQRLEIHNKKNWRKSPRAMLAARATTELCRLIFADVIHGMRAIEEFDELEAGVPEDAVEVTQIESPTIRRASGHKATPQVTAGAPPAAQQGQPATPRKRATVPQRGAQPPEEPGASFPEGDAASPGPDERKHLGPETPTQEELDRVADEMHVPRGTVIPRPDDDLSEAAAAAISQEIDATAERIDQMVEGAGEESQEPEPEQSFTGPPPTRGQVTRLQMHSSRLGIGGDENRDFRLTVFATLAGVDPITSSNDLRPDQAGHIIEILERCKDRAALGDMLEKLQ